MFVIRKWIWEDQRFLYWTGIGWDTFESNHIKTFTAYKFKEAAVIRDKFKAEIHYRWK